MKKLKKLSCGHEIRKIVVFCILIFTEKVQIGHEKNNLLFFQNELFLKNNLYQP
jgi:hypothetical protein